MKYGILGYNDQEMGKTFLIIFLVLEKTFLWQIVPKNQHLMRVSMFQPPINAQNGTFSQPESRAEARRNCDAGNNNRQKRWTLCKRYTDIGAFCHRQTDWIIL